MALSAPAHVVSLREAALEHKAASRHHRRQAQRLMKEFTRTCERLGISVSVEIKTAKTPEEVDHGRRKLRSIDKSIT